jgi:outer membrane protein
VRCHVLIRHIPVLAMPLFSAAAMAAADDAFSTLDMVPSAVTGTFLPAGGEAPCSAAAGTGSPLALADVVERALCNNPQTREAWANSRFEAAQYGSSRSAYWPTISATGSASLNNTNASGSSSTYNQESAGITLGYVLYDFGARDANLENARQVLTAANATHDATLQTVFLAAVQSYYQLFAAQAAVDSARESEKSNQESFNAAAARYNTGVGTPADKLQAQTAFSQAVLNRVRAEGDLRNARGILANVMGLDANAPVEVAPPATLTPPLHFEEEVARLIDVARSHRPDLSAAEAQIKAAQAGVAAAEASGKPTVSLSTSLNFADSSIADSSRNAALGVQVSIPLFTGYNTTYRIRAAREQVEIKQAQREKLSLQIALDVWKSYQGLITETQSVRTSEDLLASATQSEKVALGRYKAGVGNILDVLTAQSALASARQQHIQELYNWHIARAVLAQAMGQLDMTAIAAITAVGNDTTPTTKTRHQP